MLNLLKKYGVLEDAITHNHYGWVNTEQLVIKPNTAHERTIAFICDNSPHSSQHLQNIKRRFEGTRAERLRNRLVSIIHPSQAVQRDSGALISPLILSLTNSDNVNEIEAEARYNLMRLTEHFRISVTDLLFVYRSVAAKLLPYSKDEYCIFKNRAIPIEIANQILANVIGIDINETEYRYTPEFIALMNITGIKHELKHLPMHFDEQVKGAKFLNFIHRLEVYLSRKIYHNAPNNNLEGWEIEVSA